MRVLLFLMFILRFIKCAKILCYFMVPSVSHQIIFQSLWKELSLRGHQVTVITPNPLKDKSLTNLTEIDLSSTYKVKETFNFQLTLTTEEITNSINVFHEMGNQFFEHQIKNVEVQKLIRAKNVQFDLLILQHTHDVPVVYGVSARFKVPIVSISSLDLFLHSHDLMGNPTHPVVSPDVMLNYSGELTFLDRLNSFWYNIWYRIYYYWYSLPNADRIARKYFGEDMPYLGDLEKNISLILVNVNPVMHTPRANVPNVIEINQMHIREKNPLPKDLQEYLDSSPQGLVYFSLGSNVKSANLSKDIKNEILGALSELPYNVLWKFEADTLSGLPDNVMIRKWLPQQDLLGHKNVKVFVTQGGIQSIEEAITNEVPMVGIPFITDQPANIKRIEDLGMGIGLNHKTLKKDSLKEAILKVATNKKFKEEVKKAKDILTDQPLKGVDKAIWWIEYVIRHKGAKHLRSPAADMSFFKYYMFDVILFILVCMCITVFALVKVASLLKMVSIKVAFKKVKKN